MKIRKLIETQALALLFGSMTACCCSMFISNGPDDLEPDEVIGPALSLLQQEAQGKPVIKAFGDKSWHEYWERRYNELERSESKNDREFLRLLKQKRREIGLDDI